MGGGQIDRQARGERPTRTAREVQEAGGEEKPKNRDRVMET